MKKRLGPPKRIRPEENPCLQKCALVGVISWGLFLLLTQNLPYLSCIVPHNTPALMVIFYVSESQI